MFSLRRKSLEQSRGRSGRMWITQTHITPRRMLRMRKTLIRNTFQNSEGDRTVLMVERLRGRLVELMSWRGAYDQAIVAVATAKWNRMRADEDSRVSHLVKAQLSSSIFDGQSKSMAKAWPWVAQVRPASEAILDGSPWPRITVVTPSYNQGRFLEETIVSVLSQGYPNLEYIIIDGGSTDNSVDIIRKYESKLAYWVSEPDRGQSHAINKGWKRATGEILTWLNSDDYYLQGTFQRVATAFNDNWDVGFVHGITQYIDAAGNLLPKTYGSEFNLDNQLRTGVNTVAQQSAFINVKALEKVGYLDENLHMGMDQELWLRIGIYFRAMFVPEIWSHFRAWEQAKTVMQWSDPEDVQIIRKLLKCNPELKLSDREKRRALAAAYGEEARKYQRVGNHWKFRQCFSQSLLYEPRMLGANARSKLTTYLFGKPLSKILSRGKKWLINEVNGGKI